MARRRQVTGSWWTLWHEWLAAPRHHAGATQRVPATRPTRRWNPHPGATSPVVTGLRTFARVDGHLLRVSVRGDGRPVLLIMGWAATSRCGTRWSASSTPGASRPSPTTRPEPGTRHPARPAAATRPRPPGCPPPGHPRPARRPRARRVVRGGVAQELALRNPHRVRRLILASTSCGLGGVPGTPVALGLLATPLRYYSPRFLRRPHAGCTARSPIPTAGSCTSRSTLAGHDPRRCGAT